MKRFSKRRRLLVGGFLLVLLVIGGLWAFENWRGAKEWESARERAEKVGVSLVRADYGGPGIPVDEDLLTEPLYLQESEKESDEALEAWRMLFADQNGRRVGFVDPTKGKTIAYQDFFADKMSEEEARVKLRELAADHERRAKALAEVVLSKPGHNFYAQSEVGQGLLAGSNHTLKFHKMGDAFRSVGLMSIRSGDPESAITMIRALDRISRISDKPTLIGFLVARAMFSVELSLVWEGIRLEIWSEEQLMSLSDLVLARDFKEAMITAIEHELAWAVEAFDQVEESGEDMLEMTGYGAPNGFVRWLQSGGPAGWTDLRKALLVNIYLDLIELVKAGKLFEKDKLSEQFPTSRFSPLVDTSLAAEMIIRVTKSYEEAVTEKRMALVALALEREKKILGSYPGDLLGLDASIETKDFTDPTGRDLAYELGPNGRPQIWSRYEQETKHENNLRLRWQFWTK